MRDLLRRRVRWSLLALCLIGAMAAGAQTVGVSVPMDHWFWNGLGFWSGLIAAGASLCWQAAILGAYRLVDGDAPVAAWLEHERLQAMGAGFVQALLCGGLLVTAEELLLRGLLLPVGGGLAVVAAAGALRWHSGRRTTLWGMAQGLLLTAVALFTGNVLAAWVAHLLTETVWVFYLAFAPWRERVRHSPIPGTGSLT